jgi:AraC-like DNA-binding protein
MRSGRSGAIDEHSPAMEIEFVEPRAELSPYIESFWIFDGPQGLPADDSSIVVPNGCAKLVIPIENDIVRDANGTTQVSHASGLYFVGNRDSSTRLWSTGVRTRFVSIEFRPQGALPIFGVPMSDTANGLWDADMVFASWGRRVREEVAETEGTGPKVALVQERLVGLLRANGRTNLIVDWCVDALRTAHGRLSVGELERRTGYSRRHLSSLFRTHVGLPPKVLARIFRFQKYYRGWAAGRSFESLVPDLYEDYYDQAHFVKEFNKMTGYSPGRFGREVTNEFGRRILRP